MRFHCWLWEVWLWARSFKSTSQCHCSNTWDKIFLSNHRTGICCCLWRPIQSADTISMILLIFSKSFKINIRKRSSQTWNFVNFLKRFLQNNWIYKMNKIYFENLFSKHLFQFSNLFFFFIFFLTQIRMFLNNFLTFNKFDTAMVRSLVRYGCLKDVSRVFLYAMDV